jgi:hypothetical protein
MSRNVRQRDSLRARSSRLDRDDGQREDAFEMKAGIMEHTREVIYE